VAPSGNPNVDPTFSPTPNPTDLFIAYVKEELLPSIDDTVDPCDDFYMYACGAELKSFAQKNQTDPGAFGELAPKVQEQLRSIIVTENFPLLSTFYEGCVDVANIQRMSTKDLFANELAAIDAAVDVPNLLAVMGLLQRHGVATFGLLNGIVENDLFTATKFILNLHPLDGDDYLGADPYDYQDTAEMVFQQLLGMSPADSASGAMNVTNLYNYLVTNLPQAIVNDVSSFTAPWHSPISRALPSTPLYMSLMSVVSPSLT
jgi:hypothetical protein